MIKLCHILLGCAGIMWLRRHGNGTMDIPGLDRKDGRSEGTT